MYVLPSSLLQLFSEKPPQRSRWTPVLWPGEEETTWRRRSGTRPERWRTVRLPTMPTGPTASSTLLLRTVKHMLHLCVQDWKTLQLHAVLWTVSSAAVHLVYFRRPQRPGSVWRDTCSQEPVQGFCVGGMWPQQGDGYWPRAPTSSDWQAQQLQHHHQVLLEATGHGLYKVKFYC